MFLIYDFFFMHFAYFLICCSFDFSKLYLLVMFSIKEKINVLFTHTKHIIKDDNVY